MNTYSLITIICYSIDNTYNHYTLRIVNCFVWSICN